MNRYLTLGLAALWLAGVPAAAQRARRPAREADTGPVTITRSATLRIAVASDTVSVFEYLSDAAKLTEWFPDQAIIEPQLGGKYHFRWKDQEGVWSGIVTEFIRGNTVAYTWEPPGEAAETNVRFKVFPQGAETLVELTHSGFTSSAAQDAAVKSWTFYLRNLKSVIEDGTDLRVQARRAAPRRTTRSRS
jgi:uncharacterized protein YndB with AHSA1/START domain